MSGLNTWTLNFGNMIMVYIDRESFASWLSWLNITNKIFVVRIYCVPTKDLNNANLR